MENANQVEVVPPSPALPTTHPSKPNNNILPLLLIICGILEISFPSYLIYSIVPQFVNLIRNLQDDPNGFLFLVFPALIFGLIIAQIFYGITLAAKQKVQGQLAPLQQKIGITMLIIGIVASVVFVPTMLYSNILTVYSLMDKF